MLWTSWTIPNWTVAESDWWRKTEAEDDPGLHPDLGLDLLDPQEAGLDPDLGPIPAMAMMEDGPDPDPGPGPTPEKGMIKEHEETKNKIVFRF